MHSRFHLPLSTLTTLGVCLLGLNACANNPASTGSGALSLPGESAVPLDATEEHWLSVGERSGIQTLGANGQRLSHWDRRAEFLDSRRTSAGGYQRTLFASFDTAQSQVLLYSVSTEDFGIRQELISDIIPFPVEGLCLHRDAQSQLHLFLLSELYEAHQYLLQPRAEQRWQLLPVRTLPTGPGTEYCATLDAQETLVTNENGTMLWAYSTHPEAEAERRLLDLAAPFGQLDDGPLGLAGSGDQLYVLTDNGPRVHRYAMQDGELSRVDGAERDLSRAGMASAETLSLADFDTLARISLYDEKQQRFHVLHESLPPESERPAPLPEVMPSAETAPMPQYGDAADDPALWIHPAEAERSLIIGTNKRQGLFVYDLQGRERQRLDVGRMNNVDVRYGVRWQGRVVDIAVASNRDLNTLAVFAIDRDSGRLELVDNLATRLDNVYGLCLYQNKGGQVFTFINDEDGRFIQYALETSDTRWSAREVRQFRVASQPEGCVADDARARLYLGEEDVGIWTLGANPEDETTLTEFARVGAELHDDVEGLALIEGADRHYLLASSQGNDSYVLFDTTAPYAPLGAFRIGMNLDASPAIDGTSETDGLEVIRANLGGLYREGVMIVQDGRNVLPQEPQNFKLVPWSAVQALFPALLP